MPIDYKEYHPKWSLISRLIRYHRAHNKCEWCGISNGIIIRKYHRDSPGAQEWDMYNNLLKNHYSKAQAMQIMKFSKVVLTVAHIDHNKKNNRFSNLAALCQRCHLKHDLPQHINNRKYGRNYKENQFELAL